MMTRWLLRRSALVAVLPLIMTLAALIALYLLDVTLLSLDKTVQNAHVIFGFFARTFPLFALAVLYALMRLLLVALTGTRPFILLRLLMWMPAAALVLIASFYPTFGGLIVRAGFGSGSFAFINDLTPSHAQMLGGMVAGALLALVLGAGHALIDWDWRLTPSRVLRGILAVATFAWAGLVLVIGWMRITQTGALWPDAPMQGSTLMLALPVLLIAFLPHVLVSLWSDHATQTGRR